MRKSRNFSRFLATVVVALIVLLAQTTVNALAYEGVMPNDRGEFQPVEPTRVNHDESPSALVCDPSDMPTALVGGGALPSDEGEFQPYDESPSALVCDPSDMPTALVGGGALPSDEREFQPMEPVREDVNNGSAKTWPIKHLAAASILLVIASGFCYKLF